MKSIFLIHIFIWAIISPCVGQSLYLDGEWYNNSLHKNIIVHSSHQGYKIKGLYSYHDWTYFEECGRNTFCDRYENFIRVVSQNRLIFYNRYRRTKLTFYNLGEERNRKYFGNRRVDEDLYSDRDDYHTYGQNQISSNNQPAKIKSKEKRSTPVNLRSPEGTWSVADSEKTVYIIDTRDGIKARFIDETVWYIFKNDKDNSGIYISNDGHRYEYLNENSLVWKDKNDTRKFYLTRMSDKIE